MTRSLTLAAALSIGFVGNNLASAHDGHPLTVGGCCGCSTSHHGGHSAYNSVPSPSNCCGGGGCSVTNSRQDRFIPSSHQLLAPHWKTPAGINAPANGSPFYHVTPQFPQRDPRSFTPPSRLHFDSVPPLPSQAQQQPTIPEGMEGIAQLAVADQHAALRQLTCPVTKELLGSMGKPIRVNVASRPVWVCCEGCVDALKSNPSNFLTSARQPEVSYLR